MSLCRCPPGCSPYCCSGACPAYCSLECCLARTKGINKMLFKIEGNLSLAARKLDQHEKECNKKHRHCKKHEKPKIKMNSGVYASIVKTDAKKDSSKDLDFLLKLLNAIKSTGNDKELTDDTHKIKGKIYNLTILQILKLCLQKKTNIFYSFRESSTINQEKEGEEVLNKPEEIGVKSGNENFIKCEFRSSMNNFFKQIKPKENCNSLKMQKWKVDQDKVQYRQEFIDEDYSNVDRHVQYFPLSSRILSYDQHSNITDKLYSAETIEEQEEWETRHTSSALLGELSANVDFEVKHISSKIQNPEIDLFENEATLKNLNIEHRVQQDVKHVYSIGNFSENSFYKTILGNPKHEMSIHYIKSKGYKKSCDKKETLLRENMKSIDKNLIAFKSKPKIIVAPVDVPFKNKRQSSTRSSIKQMSINQSRGSKNGRQSDCDTSSTRQSATRNSIKQNSNDPSRCSNNSGNSRQSGYETSSARQSATRNSIKQNSNEQSRCSDNFGSRQSDYDPSSSVSKQKQSVSRNSQSTSQCCSKDTCDKRQSERQSKNSVNGNANQCCNKSTCESVTGSISKSASRMGSVRRSLQMNNNYVPTNQLNSNMGWIEDTVDLEFSKNTVLANSNYSDSVPSNDLGSPSTSTLSQTQLAGARSVNSCSRCGRRYGCV